MKTTITLEEVLPYSPCYSLEQLKRTFGNKKSLTYKEIFKLGIPDRDIVWILSKDHFLSKDQRLEFTIFCFDQCIKNLGEDLLSIERVKFSIEKAKKVWESFDENNKEDKESLRMTNGYPYAFSEHAHDVSLRRGITQAKSIKQAQLDLLLKMIESNK
jgi:hypothetical protein